MSTFIRLLESSVDEKAAALKIAVEALCQDAAPAENPCRVFECSPEQFSQISGSPFAYWTSDAVRALFSALPTFGSNERPVRLGASTKNDFRFLRVTWEIDACGSSTQRWCPLAKGGEYSPYYSDIHLMILWADNAHEIEAELLRKFPYLGDNVDFVLHRNDPHFRPGLTWPRRTQSGFGIRAMPAGCIFADKGPAAFVENDSPEQLRALMAITASAAFRYLVELQMAFGSYEVGVIQRTPIPELSTTQTQELATLAHRAWSLKRSLDTVNETSHSFLLPPGLNERITGFDRSAVEAELVQIQRQIDDRALELYGIGPEDRTVIEASNRTSACSEDEVDEFAKDDDENEAAETADTGESAAVTSWLVGVTFGRFDPRLVTRERAVPLTPEPFDPLPTRSPGMWPESETPKDGPGILVDDEGHADDLAARVKRVAEQVRWQPPEDVRTWLAREFFLLHLKMYSKSRRKAPIYWQLATRSGGYSVWLYIHAFTKDTLFRVQHDYASPKLMHEERQLEALRQEVGENPSASQRKRIAAQESLVEELRVFLEEIGRVAPLWNPDLDDGVIINFAPLWRLVPHCKSWQKELKAIWKELCEGKYDWSHLAMHLWPDRVVPKCAKDRSLAIAHGLEEVFWMENSEGKWEAREIPTRSIEELVRERTSPAVKAALDSLLQAPVAQNGRGRSKNRRTRATGSA
jgi:hypothetical protein